MDRDLPAAVDVWFWSLDADRAAVERLTALLSPGELARAARFFSKGDRERWIVSRARTRELLAGVMNIPVATVAFGQEAHGRPCIAGAFPRIPSFNVSHTDRLAVLAVSFDVRVGVDAEAIRPIEEPEIAWALSPAERKQLDGVDPADRLETFFRFWTLKEAFMKGTGLGASLPLHDFDIGLAGPELLRLAGAADEPALWRFAEAAPLEGIRAAVSARTDGRNLTVTWRQPGH